MCIIVYVHTYIHTYRTAASVSRSSAEVASSRIRMRGCLDIMIFPPAKSIRANGRLNPRLTPKESNFE